MSDKQTVLILCTGNSARSQMAEGLLRHDAGDLFDVHSAGTRPTAVRPEAIAVMREVGVDISGHRSKSVDVFIGNEIDYVITVRDRANEFCPVFPGTSKHLHWSLPDPAAVSRSDEDRKTAFRQARDEIRDRLKTFVVEHRVPLRKV